MKFKFEYAVGGLLLLVFTIALFNLGSVREHFEYQQNQEMPALLRGKCPEGCSSSSVTTADGKRTESCSKNDSLGNITKCPVLDKCPPGDVEKDGLCQYCQEGLKIVDGKCLPTDKASFHLFAAAPCPTGCTFYNGGCLKDDAKKCTTGELGRDDPICVRNRGIPFSERSCPYAPCPDNGQEFNGICRKCPAGKKLDNKLLCVPDPTKKVEDDSDDDNKKYIIYGVIAVVAVAVIVAIMLMASSRPAGGKRRSR